MIKLAIIGTGRMGTYHTRVAAQNTDVVITALVNPTAPSDELLKIAPSAQYYTSHADVVTDVDAAIIATPTPTHFEIARDFLREGKHVLIEKPITASYTEASELFKLARKYNCVLHVGHVERYNPAFIAAQRMIKSTPHLIRTVRSGPFNERVKHDSVIIDLMIHDIDLLLTITKEAPLETSAIGRSHVSQVVDTALAHMQFQSGTLASLSTHRGAAATNRGMIIQTTEQTLALDLATRTLMLTDASGVHIFKPERKSNPLADQLEYFTNAIVFDHHHRQEYHDLAVLSQALLADEQTKAILVPPAEKDLLLKPVNSLE